MKTTTSALSTKTKIRSYLELVRPANIVTAFADILAGSAAAWGIQMLTKEQLLLQIVPEGLVWLLFATAGLYGGGVVFNDLFDAKLDARERPERAIPSGRVSKSEAAILGILLFATGVFCAFQVQPDSGYLALFITGCALLYDRWAKHSVLWGPLFMGSCRGANLLLGVSILPAALSQAWFLALLPITYIGAITLISRGEVHGGSKRSGYFALGLILLVFSTLSLLAVQPSYHLMYALPFILLFGLLIIPSFVKATAKPEAKNIKSAVKRGVLSLIVLNSVLAAGYAGLIPGMLVVALLPISLLLSRLFAVT